MDIKEVIKNKEYNFLRENEHLKDNVVLLALGGSYAYGTNNENSDIDIRGIALNSEEDLLSINEPFEQFVDNNTDTTIYAFNKIIKLLMNCNPNTIELLGCLPEHYIINDIGKMLIDNASLFLSQKCVYSFAGYANAQLRRLDNKINRLNDLDKQEQHLLKTIEHSQDILKDKYNIDMKFYIDKSNKENINIEIFTDLNLEHYPLRDYSKFMNEVNNILTTYNKLSHLNKNTVEHNKLSKHMMHLIRLYMMCIDILEKEKIITYRKNEHNLLMDIRNGKYLNNNQPTNEFFELLNDYEKRLDYAKQDTSLQKQPNYKLINEFVMSINERIIKN